METTELPKHRLDAVLIAGDSPQEVLGGDVRERLRLTVDGVPASLPFLREYFACGRDVRRATRALSDREAPFLSLNAPYLAQYLERRGFAVAVVPLFSHDPERFAGLMARDPRAVVISTTFLPFAGQVDAIAAAVKASCPRAIVIAGGIQVWKSHRHRQLFDAGDIAPDVAPEVSRHNYLMDPTRPSPVDILVVSDSGEATLSELLGRLRDGRSYEAMDNLALFRQGRWRVNAVRPEPAAEVSVDWGRYLPRPAPVYVPVQAGLGCGFRCRFCDFRGLRPDRLRDPDSIVAELRTIPPCEGVRRVYFTDDNLFHTRERAERMCRRMIAARLGLRWRGMIRISTVNDTLAGLMAESGCLEVLLGIESGDADMLRRMGKNTTPEQILRGVGLLARHGIHTKSTFIVGFPGETEATTRHTAELLNAYPVEAPVVHRYLFFTFAVLPLSEAASPEARRRYGLRGYGYHWAHDTMNSEQAAQRMEELQEALRDELCPNYVLEVPELPGLSPGALKRIVVLRNRLARLRRGSARDAAAEAALWTELEAAFAPAHSTSME